jgi:copper chaperone CopZ
MTIERTLKTVPGVSDAHADLPTKSVRLTVTDDAAADRARAALAEAGYPVAE